MIKDSETMRTHILEQADRCVTVDRNAQYGEPEDNFEIIAKFWSDYLGFGIDAHDVGVMMTLFKIARIKGGGVKEDNYVDACGYLACAGEIALKNEAEGQ